MAAEPAELGRPFHQFELHAPGALLQAWFFPADTNAPWAGKVILLCHGNAGNISHRLAHAETFLNAGASAFLFDYRGYGRSSGKPSEKGLYADARAAYDFLIGKGVAATNIILFGESLGSAVATELASTEPTGGLVLLSGFTSIPDLGRELFPFIPRFLGSIRFNSLERIPRVNAPVLVIHSRLDTLIGFHHGQKLFAAAPEPKTFLEIQADHNESFYAEGQVIADALRGMLRR